METATLIPTTRKLSNGESAPNPLGLQSGETVVMDAEMENPKAVTIERIGYRGYMAIVVEVESGKRWTLSISSLSRM